MAHLAAFCLQKPSLFHQDNQLIYQIFNSRHKIIKPEFSLKCIRSFIKCMYVKRRGEHRGMGESQRWSVNSTKRSLERHGIVACGLFTLKGVSVLSRSCGVGCPSIHLQATKTSEIRWLYEVPRKFAVPSWRYLAISLHLVPSLSL